MDIAIGELGLDRDQTLRMTWGDLWRRIYGYRINQDKEWDRTRHIVAIIYNTHRGKGQAAKKPQRMLPLPIDRMHKRLEWTEEDYNKYEQALKAWDFDLLKKGEGKRLDKDEADQLSKNKWEH